MKFEQVNLLKSTTLAFVGDSVFTLFVRSRLADPHIPPRELVRKSARIVSAVVQAAIYDEIEALLDEEELSVAKRCINSHLSNKAKSATMLEYKKATALEGIIGALFLAGERERLECLLNKCYEKGEQL